MQDYKFCMKTEQNLEDEATLPWFAAILGLDFASNDQHKIKKQGNFEKGRHQKKQSKLGTLS